MVWLAEVSRIVDAAWNRDVAGTIDVAGVGGVDWDNGATRVGCVASFAGVARIDGVVWGDGVT